MQREVIQMDDDDAVDAEEADAEPTVDELLAALWGPGVKKKAYVLGVMQSNRHDTIKKEFISRLAGEDRGKKLLESMVKGSVINWIPDVSRVTNVMKPIPPSKKAQWAAMIPAVPIALLGGFALGIQKLLAEGWSRSPFTSHRDWIKELMRLEFDVTFSNHWSEAELRKTYLAFHLVPDGTVRACVNGLERNKFSIGSFASGSDISMAGLLPTGSTMGGVEPYSRLFGQKFLKTGSKYSSRMKYKNAWTMTTLHELGHTVDNKRGVMDAHGENSEFGGWTDFHNSQLADEMKESLTVPPPTPNCIQTPRQIQKWNHSIEWCINDFASPDGNGDNTIREEAEDITRTYNLTPHDSQDLKSALASHPMVKMAKKNFKLGAWNRSDDTMREMAAPFGGRYFHRSYTQDWVSFEVESRKDAVSNYQYRAPGEWFAELYAHYYMGTLDGHPLKGWFEREIDQNFDPETMLAPPAPPNAEDVAAHANDNDN
ncbi:hypothetical protein [Pseudenhygromyxa sp. WMMC2535]|uniref:hypothetical protein n=1 Tax=Pseudenhygromyxa sp. WMMC2535 TaxID=2712867 RepID=UPI0020D16050|nr:hypothetical protein [Pseudenhygromyxa sp. WMMC2535]